MLDVMEVTVEGLREGKYREELPELYELESVVENNVGHNNQSVLEHTIKTFGALKDILKEQKSGKEKLLLIAALLHDIGKKVALTAQRDGDTLAFSHADIGAPEVPKFKERFGLTDDETDYVRKLVLLHDFAFAVVNLNMRKPEFKESLVKGLKERAGDAYVDMIILARADAMGGDMETNNPEGYKNFLKMADALISEG